MGHPPYFSRVIHRSCSFYIEKLRSKWGNMDDMRGEMYVKFAVNRC